VRPVLNGGGGVKRVAGPMNVPPLGMATSSLARICLTIVPYKERRVREKAVRAWSRDEVWGSTKCSVFGGHSHATPWQDRKPVKDLAVNRTHKTCLQNYS
jgi:hypothetical protein